LSGFQDVGKLCKHLRRIEPPGGIVWRVDNDDACPRRERSRDFAEINLEGGTVMGTMIGAAPALSIIAS
jgi:hypothetical protein